MADLFFTLAVITGAIVSLYVAIQLFRTRGR